MRGDLFYALVFLLAIVGMCFAIYDPGFFLRLSKPSYANADHWSSRMHRLEREQTAQTFGVVKLATFAVGFIGYLLVSGRLEQ